MFKSIIDFFEKFKKHFESTEIEEYIKSRNPQNAAEVDALEREYYRTRQMSIFDKYY